MKSKLKYILFIALAALGFVLFMVGLRRWGGVLRSFLDIENERRREQDVIDRQTQQQLDQARTQREQDLTDYVRQKRAEKLASEQQYREGVRIAEQRAREATNNAQTQEDLDRETDAAIEKHTRYLNGHNKQDGSVRRPLLPILLLAAFVILMLSSQAQPASPSSQPTEAQRERTRKILATLDRYQQLVEKLKRDLVTEKKACAQLVDLKGKHARREERILCQSQVRRCQAELRACTAKQSILIRHTCPPCWPYATVTGLVVAGLCGGVIGIREATRTCP